MYEGISDRKRSEFDLSKIEKTKQKSRKKKHYLDQQYPTIVDEQFYPLGTLSLRGNQYQLLLDMYYRMNRT